MKNLFLFAFAISIVSSVYAQTGAAAFSKKSDRLTDATGWELCDDGFGGCKIGTWTDNKNQILYEKSDQINSHESNFKWLQSATYMDKGKKYYIFFYQKRSGDYEYPLTQAGWREYEEVIVQIMDADEYAQLKAAIAAKDGSDVDIELQRDEKFIRIDGGYDDAQVAAKVRETLQQDINMETHNSCIRVSVQNIKGADVVQFLLPGRCSIFTLKQEYYEVKLDDFKKLLID